MPRDLCVLSAVYVTWVNGAAALQDTSDVATSLQRHESLQYRSNIRAGISHARGSRVSR